MDRQFYSDSSRKICFALIVVCLLLGSVCVLKHFIVHESGAFIARLKSMPFYPPKNQLNSVKIASSLRRLQSYPLSRLTNLAAKFPPPPAPAPAPTSLDSHGCERECGKILIPYPFGLSPECARSSAFQLNCTQSNSTLAKLNLQDPVGPWPFLSAPNDSFQVINISSRFLIINATNIKAISTPSLQSNGSCHHGSADLALDPVGPYIISSANLILVVGCGSVGSISPLRQSASFDINLNCGPPCIKNNENPVCNYYDCCAFSLTATTNISMMASGSFIYGNNNCGFCTIAYPESYSTWNAASFGVGQYGVQLLWAIQDYYSCDDAHSKPDYACTSYPASCVDVVEVLIGYVCRCTVAGYHGDGYRNGSGCSDIDECADARLNNCTENATCTNFPGTYTCSCKNGLKGDGYLDGTGCIHSKSHVALKAGIINGVGILLIANVTIIWCLWKNGLRDRFEPSNVSFHDALTEIQKQDGANVCKLFSLKDLKGATKNFCMENELGRGGFGTVFRGVLVDGTIVAIKKPKNDVGGSHDDVKQFINEVTILSQVNHRNLVRLLGCCLETRIPLLVYEYISNGNLFDCLHPKAKSNEGKYSDVLLPWDKRLKIAVGTAEALNYLHFGTSPPIYHRDVKSSNILLDDDYHSKVADFGLSRLVPIEATHLSTMLQGTPGYLDPEFFDNFQISDKSDVYSFGVVLIELISARKPVDLSRESGDQNLVIRFSGLVKEARLEDMIDVALDASSDPDMLQAIYKVAEVALKCVQRSGKHRPSMKKVLDELDFIKNNYKGSTNTTSFEPSDPEWVPLKAGMSDSSRDHGFISFNQSSSLRYGSSSSSYANAPGSSIELPQR